MMKTLIKTSGMEFPSSNKSHTQKTIIFQRSPTKTMHKQECLFTSTHHYTTIISLSDKVEERKERGGYKN